MSAVETRARADDARAGPDASQDAVPRLLRFGPPAVAAVVALAFIAISVWWVQADARVPSGDNGKHLLIAFGYHDLIKNGYPLSVLGQYNFYPPVVHIVGAIGSLIAGPSVKTAVISENLVFVPMLAAGCYGVGRLAFGPWAGALAAVFAFATPMIGALFHVFMLDAPTAAVAAVTVWALLASDRFSRVSISALAGVAMGAGMYAKSTFPFFVAGLIAVMLIRGGWRNRRGWLSFGAISLLIALPWYVKHWGSIAGQTKGAVAAQQINWHGSVPYPDRFSVDNFTWYGWNLVNNQLLLPLTLFFVIGLLFFGWRWVVRRRPDSVSPELIAGGVGTYIGVSLISLDDPRYTLPGLVYLAVLGTGWIVFCRRPLQLVAAAALAGVLVLNTAQLNLGEPRSNLAIHLPGEVANPISEGQFKVTSTIGYVEAQPDRKGGKPLFDLLERAREDGARRVVFEPDSLNNGGYNLNGLAVVARSAGLETPGYETKWIQTPRDIFVFRRLPEGDLPKPCIYSFAIGDGTGFYIQWGPANPKQRLRCPS